jgi:large subunit ribosomal protein L9
VKVIFVKDVPGSGKKGETKEVADGFARNYLLPHSLAMLATKGSLQDIQTTAQQEAASKSREHAAMLKISESINGKTVRFQAKVGGGERLFGSITNADIAKAVSEMSGHAVDKRHVELKETLRTLGKHEVTVKLAKDVEARVTVMIEPKKG